LQQSYTLLAVLPTTSWQWDMTDGPLLLLLLL
jgi:hypothetical protein